MLITILKNYWRLILIFTVVGASASFGLSLAKKPVYVAESRILVRYFQTQGVDAYAASRAAGKIAQIFSEISRTELFLEKVLDTQFAKGLSAPPVKDPAARRQFWDDTISVSTGIDSSILKIRAYSQRPEDAKRYVEAVSYVLLKSGEEFHGADGLVSLKQVDRPFVLKDTVQPGMIMNTIGGLFAGCLLGFLIAAVFTGLVLQSARRLPVTLTESYDERRNLAPSTPSRMTASLDSTIESKWGDLDSRQVARDDKKALREISQREIQTNPNVVGQQYQLNKTSGPLLRTVFDDLNRLGLNPAELKFET